MEQPSSTRLTRDDYFRWAVAQPSGKFERVAGEVIRLAPERWRHNRLKLAIHQVLSSAAGAGLEVGIDGITVAVDDNDFEPDVVVHQGDPIPLDAMVVPNPVIIVEVLSPSTARIDTTYKLEAYLKLPSLSHYLVVRSDRRAVIHWQRGSDRPSHPAIGPLTLDPPGLTIDLSTIYDRAGIA